MKKIIKCSIIILMILLSTTILLVWLYKEDQKDTQMRKEYLETVTTSDETTTTTTKKKTTTTTKKTTKKVTKTTATKKSSRINIKYDRQEIINYTYQRVVVRFGEEHWDAVYNIVSHESGWNPNSWNKSSTACGLFQACPCYKSTVKNGYKDYYTNWKTQVEWGLDYIEIRYKTPKNAWKFWQKHHWY